MERGAIDALFDEGIYNWVDQAIDFSGSLVYTHAAVPDDVVEAFCTALDARHGRIPWRGGDSLPIERMVGDAVDARIPIPFHPAAERYWTGRGNRP